MVLFLTVDPPVIKERVMLLYLQNVVMLEVVAGEITLWTGEAEGRYLQTCILVVSISGGSGI